MYSVEFVFNSDQELLYVEVELNIHICLLGWVCQLAEALAHCVQSFYSRIWTIDYAQILVEVVSVIHRVLLIIGGKVWGIAVGLEAGALGGITVFVVLRVESNALCLCTAHGLFIFFSSQCAHFTLLAHSSSSTLLWSCCFLTASCQYPTWASYEAKPLLKGRLLAHLCNLIPSLILFLLILNCNCTYQLLFDLIKAFNLLFFALFHIPWFLLHFLFHFLWYKVEFFICKL